ncbi:hypothetical protein Nepgr_016250 [Nepenthes gracilis]|uniref:SURP motif domain-containing protein n=1 Tax=Nepenthes gracilis TaxID=150966 RepID=A0AAD3SPG2_NEPGR|nr:hypothetical protein Nepgr_016250 [Nepenthes gracilis]
MPKRKNKHLWITHFMTIQQLWLLLYMLNCCSSMQYPFLHTQQPQQHHSHPPPHPHLLHLQQQQPPPPPCNPSMLPCFVPSLFCGPYNFAPPLIPPPSDPELHKNIDSFVEYAAKNGPDFKAMFREKHQDSPGYSFLFGGENHGCYRYKL